MKSKKSTLKKKLDRLVQSIYVPLNPKCLVCGGETSEMHHFYQKRQSLFLRWDIRNLINLCKSCHYKHHLGDPSIHWQIYKIKGEKWADQLMEDRQQIFKDTISNLKEIEKKLLEVK